MNDFLSEYRRIGLALSKYSMNGPDADSAARASLCHAALQSNFRTLVPGAQHLVAPQLAGAFGQAYNQWSYALKSGDTNPRAEKELEAAWALTAACHNVRKKFHVSEHVPILDALLNRDVSFEAERDLMDWNHSKDEAEKGERWPGWIFCGVIGFAIAFGDMAAGTDGQATALIGMGGIGCFAYALFMRAQMMRFRQQRTAIIKKWGGSPERYLFLKKFSDAP